MTCMKRGPCKTSYLVCAFIILGLAMASHSYVLPACQILSFMIEQFGSARACVVFQETVIYDPALEGGMQEFEETLYYRYPDQFRCEVGTPGSEQVRVVSPEGAIFVMNGKIIAETEDPFDHFKDLLLYRQVGLLGKRLSQLDVNLDLVSLGRYKDRIAYVIGAKYPDESVSQVWIEKNTFRPIRYVLSGGGPNGGALEEIEYADYMSLGKERWYPARILFFQHGRLARMYLLKTFKVNPDLSDQLFDIAYLKTVYQPIASTKPLPLPKSELDEVEKTIRDFRRTFE
jgi:outer membrane lipoprotein-sorting protein